MGVGDGVFEVFDNGVLVFERGGAVFIFAGFDGTLFAEHAGGDLIDDGGDVRHLLAEGADAFEFAVGGREVVFIGGHRFGEGNDFVFDHVDAAVVHAGDEGSLRRIGSIDGE